MREERRLLGKVGGPLNRRDRKGMFYCVGQRIRWVPVATSSVNNEQNSLHQNHSVTTTTHLQPAVFFESFSLL